MGTFYFEGKPYDDTQYYIGYNGSEKAVFKRTGEDIEKKKSNGEAVANQGDFDAGVAAKQRQERQDKWNKFKQGAGNAMQGASKAAAYAGAATAKAQGINDPQAGHYAQQAALSEAQAAKMRADEQLARQEAYRNSGDRALTESAKMAEASSAANIRNNQKAMSAEMGGAAATMSAQKNANVDPMQNAMALKQQGYNRQDTATQLGQQAATYQSGAEAQRANATESGELMREKTVANEEKARAAKAQAEQDEEDRRIRNNEIQAKADYYNSMQKQNDTNTQVTQSTLNEKASTKIAEPQRAIENYLQNDIESIDVNELLNLDNAMASAEYNTTGNSANYEKFFDSVVVPYLRQRAGTAQNYIDAWATQNKKAKGSPEYNAFSERILSDSRMKNIHSPAGKALLHIYKGRTR